MGRVVQPGCNPDGDCSEDAVPIARLEPHRVRVSRDRDSVEILAWTGWCSRNVTRLEDAVPITRLEPHRLRVALSRTGSGSPATGIVRKSSHGEGGTAGI